MEQYLVKDIMIPISEYATVRIGSTLLAALELLEQAIDNQEEGSDRHRAILVLDHDDNVIGKIGQLTTLQVVDQQTNSADTLRELERFQFSPSYNSWLRDHYRAKGKAVNAESLAIAAETPVEKCMQDLAPGEFVAEDDTLDIAIHRLIAGTHLGLLVTNGDRIVGILRVSDVFSTISKEMKATQQMASDNSP